MAELISIDPAGEHVIEPDGYIAVTHTVKDHSGARVTCTHSVPSLLKELPSLVKPVLRALPWRQDRYDQWARMAPLTLGRGHKGIRYSSAASRPVTVTSKGWSLYQLIKSAKASSKARRSSFDCSQTSSHNPADIVCSSIDDVIQLYADLKQKDDSDTPGAIEKIFEQQDDTDCAQEMTDKGADKQFDLLNSSAAALGTEVRATGCDPDGFFTRSIEVLHPESTKKEKENSETAGDDRGESARKASAEKEMNENVYQYPRSPSDSGFSACSTSSTSCCVTSSSGVMGESTGSGYLGGVAPPDSTVVSSAAETYGIGPFVDRSTTVPQINFQRSLTDIDQSIYTSRREGHCKPLQLWSSSVPPNGQHDVVTPAMSAGEGTSQRDTDYLSEKRRSKTVTMPDQGVFSSGSLGGFVSESVLSLKEDNEKRVLPKRTAERRKAKLSFLRTSESNTAADVLLDKRYKKHNKNGGHNAADDVSGSERYRSRRSADRTSQRQSQAPQHSMQYPQLGNRSYSELTRKPGRKHEEASLQHPLLGNHSSGELTKKSGRRDGEALSLQYRSHTILPTAMANSRRTHSLSSSWASSSSVPSLSQRNRFVRHSVSASSSSDELPKVQLVDLADLRLAQINVLSAFQDRRSKTIKTDRAQGVKSDNKVKTA